MNFFIHATRYGRTVSVFYMNSNHIENTINMLIRGLINNKYKNSNFVKAKIKLYLGILEKRNHIFTLNQNYLDYLKKMI